LFVAVGDSGTVVSSPDGVAWTVGDAGVGIDNFCALASDGASFMACTAGATPQILASNDAVNWTPRATALGEFTGVARAPQSGPWVAVGGSGSAYSNDGIVWSQSTQPGASPSQVVHTGGRAGFVGLGRSTAGQDTVWTSADGQAWLARTVNANWRVMAKAPGLAGRIVALPTGNRSAASTDGGTTWTFGTELPDEGRFDELTWFEAQSKFFAVVHDAGGRFVHASDDGLKWTRLGASVLPLAGRFCGSPDLLVIVGSTAEGFAASDDGLTWTMGALPADVGALHDLRWLGSMFLGVGAGGAIVTSSDGSAWVRQVSGTSAALRGAAASPTHLVVVGESGTVRVSTDAGLTWAAGNSGTTSSLSSVAWTGNAFVSVGASGLAIRSADGAKWAPQTTPYMTVLPGSNPLHLHDVLWQGERLLICGARGLLASAQ
jgi:hypothetical protein